MSQVILRPINLCTVDQQNAVRDLRNQSNIRKYMYSDHIIEFEEHLAWLEKIKNDTRQIVFVVLVECIVSGVVSVNDIDLLHKKSNWAIYLDEKVRGGLGIALEFWILEFVFNELKMEKLNCEVIETNEVAIKFYKKLGFIEEGLRRFNIEKEGNRIGVFFLGITKKEWIRHRVALSQRYKSIFSQFDLSIESDTND